MNNKYQDVMLRKEKAGKKAESVSRKLDQLKYELIENDIIILNGPYINKSVRELWNIGEAERDYIVNKLWSLGDEKINKIIKDLVCR